VKEKKKEIKAAYALFFCYRGVQTPISHKGGPFAITIEFRLHGLGRFADVNQQMALHLYSVMQKTILLSSVNLPP